MEIGNDALRERCREIAGRVLARHDWRLARADDEAFLDAITKRVSQQADVSSDTSERVIHQAVQYVYCTGLHHYFRTPGAEEQERAMLEVHRHVYRALYCLTGQNSALADECAQQALTQAWAKAGQVHDPGAFLGWVLRIAVRHVHQLTQVDCFVRHTTEQPQEVWEQYVETADDVATTVEKTDMYGQIAALIPRCLRRAEERRIIHMHVLGGYGFKELSVAWGVPASQLAVWKFRAIQHLRECPELSRFWNEWIGQGHE